MGTLSYSERVRGWIAGWLFFFAGRLDSAYDVSLDEHAGYEVYARMHGLVARGVEATRLTRDYLGAEALPALDGWAWFDWIKEVRVFLEHEPCEFGCGFGDESAAPGAGFGLVTACAVHAPLMPVYALLAGMP